MLSPVDSVDNVFPSCGEIGPIQGYYVRNAALDGGSQGARSSTKNHQLPSARIPSLGAV